MGGGGGGGEGSPPWSVRGGLVLLAGALIFLGVNVGGCPPWNIIGIIVGWGFLLLGV